MQNHNGHRTRKILVVEQDDKSRFAMEAVLRERGYEITTAITGDEGIPLANTIYDAAVLDMSSMNGRTIDLAELLRKNHPHTRIIFVTTREEIIRAPVPGSVLLVKPIDIDTLCKLL